jgi:hypothetical protein
MTLTEFFVWCLAGGFVFAAAIWIATWWILRIPEEEDRRAEVARQEDGCPYCGAPQNPLDPNGYISFECGFHAAAQWERPKECVRRELERTGL